MIFFSPTKLYIGNWGQVKSIHYNWLLHSIINLMHLFPHPWTWPIHANNKISRHVWGLGFSRRVEGVQIDGDKRERWLY